MAFDDNFDALVRDTLDEWKVPGLSIAVVDGDQTFTKGYGFASLPDTPATPETLWYGASTTKAHVGAALSVLIDSGKYPELSQGWSTPICTILREEFVLQDDWVTANITLEDAVCHRTGIGGHDLSSIREIGGRQCTPRDVVLNMRHLPLFYKPRTTYEYSNAMYVALSRVIEVVTGKPLGDVLKMIIWEPLGMTSTFFDLDEALNHPRHFASGYIWDENENTYREMPKMTVTEESGAGAILSNVVDYAKWVRCLANEEQPFSKSVHKDIQTPRMISKASPDMGFDCVLYGLGWERVSYKGYAVYKHSGGMHAYGAYAFWMPEIKFGVVAFANTCGTSNAVQIVLAMELINNRLKIAAESRPDFSASLHVKLNSMLERLRNPLDRLYPQRPLVPAKSSFTISQLVGKYHHPGYGTVMLREDINTDNDKIPTLVCDRPETTWKYSMAITHVSGDYWITYVKSYARFFDQVLATKFVGDVSGKVSAMDITLASPSEVLNGLVSFTRIHD